MPALNTKRLAGPRYNPINLKVWRRFKKENKIDISFSLFKDIIWKTNQKMADYILSDGYGIQLPERLGYIMVTKYKSSKVPLDWINTRRLGKKVPLLNLHSLGFVHHIKWFRIGVGLKSPLIDTYKFEAIRPVKRRLAKLVKSGKQYFEWQNSDLWSSTKLIRNHHKMYKKYHEHE